MAQTFEHISGKIAGDGLEFTAGEEVLVLFLVQAILVNLNDLTLRSLLSLVGSNPGREGSTWFFESSSVGFEYGSEYTGDNILVSNRLQVLFEFLILLLEGFILLPQLSVLRDG